MIAAALAALVLAAAEAQAPPRAAPSNAGAAATDAPAPSAAGPGQAGTPPPGVSPGAQPPRVRRTAISAGAFGSRVYGLSVSGATLRVGPSYALGSRPGMPFFTGADVSFVLDVGSTPERLRVVHAEAEAMAWGRAGPFRLGLGIGLGAIDFERATGRGGRLIGLLPSLHALAGLDLALRRGLDAFVALQLGVSMPFRGYEGSYPSFPRAALVGGVRL
jgi:hypothetical protein